MGSYVSDAITIIATLCIISTTSVFASINGVIYIKGMFTASEHETDNLQDNLTVWWVASLGAMFYLFGLADMLRGDSIVYIAFAILGSLAMWSSRYLWKKWNPEPTFEPLSKEEIEQIRIGQADDDPNWKPDTKSINPS